MNSILLAATNPEEIALTLNAVIGLLGGSSVLCVGLSVWIGGIGAKRIAQQGQARLDEQLEAVKTELQKEMKLFEEKLAKERRADEAKHKVLSETMSMLGQLLVRIQSLINVHANGRDAAPQWCDYNEFLPRLVAHYSAYEIPYLQCYKADFLRIEACVNAVAASFEGSRKSTQPFTLDFSRVQQAVRDLQLKIAEADGIR